MSIKRNGGIVFFTMGRLGGSIYVKRSTIPGRRSDAKPRGIVEQMRRRIIETERHDNGLSMRLVAGTFGASLICFVSALSTII